MASTDSTITSPLKQERGACGHTYCSRRVTCQIEYLKWRYRQRRKAGMPSWMAESRSTKGMIKKWHLNKLRSREHTKRGLCVVWVKRFQAKNKELYGGNPSTNTQARARWIIVKEGLRYEKV